MALSAVPATYSEASQHANLVQALANVTEKFPNVVLAYWERDEFARLGKPVDDDTWKEIRKEFSSTVYDIVGESGAVDGTLAYLARSQEGR